MPLRGICKIHWEKNNQISFPDIWMNNLSSKHPEAKFQSKFAHTSCKSGCNLAASSARCSSVMLQVFFGCRRNHSVGILQYRHPSLLSGSARISTASGNRSFSRRILLIHFFSSVEKYPASRETYVKEVSILRHQPSQRAGETNP